MLLGGIYKKKREINKRVVFLPLFASVPGSN